MFGLSAHPSFLSKSQVFLLFQHDNTGQRSETVPLPPSRTPDVEETFLYVHYIGDNALGEIKANNQPTITISREDFN